MRIGLLVPPAISQDKIPERVYGCTFTYYKQPQLPLLYVASILEREGHEITLKDFTSDNSWQEYTRFIQTASSDVYIFHTVLLAESADLHAAEYILKHTQSRIIFFGPHPTLKPESFLLSEQCYVARGEAEFIIRDLLRAFHEGTEGVVKGISYIKDGEMAENETFGVIEDLDALAFPARHLLPEKLRSSIFAKISLPLKSLLTAGVTMKP